jgi:hypothetical protein
MSRSLHFAGLIALCAVLGFAEQAAKGGGPAALRPNFKGVPKGGVPKAAQKGPRITNPGSQAARLFRATPEQRERVLEKLPANRQVQMRRELAWFDGLPKDQQDQVIRRSERWTALTPEKQQAVQRQMQALNRLPQERTRAVRQALLRLQNLPDDERAEILSRERFRSQFSAEELQIITDLAAVMPPPR